MEDNNKKFNELDPELQIKILNTILNEEENIDDLNNEETNYVFKEALSAMKNALVKVQVERNKKICQERNKHNYSKYIKESHIGFKDDVSYRYDVLVRKCNTCGEIDIKEIGQQKRK